MQEPWSPVFLSIAFPRQYLGTIIQLTASLSDILGFQSGNWVGWQPLISLACLSLHETSILQVRWGKFNWGLSIIGFPGGTVVKNLPANAGDTRDVGSIPGLGLVFIQTSFQLDCHMEEIPLFGCYLKTLSAVSSDLSFI